MGAEKFTQGQHWSADECLGASDPGRVDQLSGLHLFFCLQACSIHSECCLSYLAPLAPSASYQSFSTHLTLLLQEHSPYSSPILLSFLTPFFESP